MAVGPVGQKSAFVTKPADGLTFRHDYWRKENAKWVPPRPTRKK